MEDLPRSNKSSDGFALRKTGFFAVPYKDCPACKVSFQAEAYLSQWYLDDEFFSPRPPCRLQMSVAFLPTLISYPDNG